MTRAKKIAIAVGLFLTIGGVYFASRPAIHLHNRPAKDIPMKFYPVRDSVIVYIPYKLVVRNNRWHPIYLNRVYGACFEDKQRLEHLLFNTYGTEIDRFYDPSYKDLSNHYFAHTYRQTVFPFSRRTFYYFRGHVLAQKDLNMKLDLNYKDQIEPQLKDLYENIAFDFYPMIKDSLYASDENKRFNLYFANCKAYKTFTIDVWAKVNRKEQRLVNMWDSVRHLPKQEIKTRILEHYLRQPIDEQLKQF